MGGLIYKQSNFINFEQAESLVNGAQGFSREHSGMELFVLVSDDATNYASYATATLVQHEQGAFVNGIQTCTATNSVEVVEAIKSGMNLIYAPTNFTELYRAVLEAVNNGTITQIRLENAVGMILTEKLQ